MCRSNDQHNITRSEVCTGKHIITWESSDNIIVSTVLFITVCFGQPLINSHLEAVDVSVWTVNSGPEGKVTSFEVTLRDFHDSLIEIILERTKYHVIFKISWKAHSKKSKKENKSGNANEKWSNNKTSFQKWEFKFVGYEAQKKNHWHTFKRIIDTMILEI